MRLFAALALCLLAAGTGPETQHDGSDASAVVEWIDGEGLLSIRAEGAPLDRLLERIATQLGVELEGMESDRHVRLVTVELERRPINQALEYTLGSVGLQHDLRRDVLRILPAETKGLDRKSLLDLASVAYLRANTRHPGHPLAASARLDQGEIEELRGNLGAALDHYQTLIDNYPDAPSVPEAHLRSGRLLQGLGRWAEAGVQFRALANLERAAGYHAQARLELARCTIELGDPESAYYMLESLESNYPTTRGESGGEWVSRQLVRAEALVGMERHLDALRTIEEVEPYMAPEQRSRSLRTRAMALSGAGMPGESGRAWLLYGQAVGGTERELALEQAARLALESDDELGALFACREAERLGLGGRVEAVRLEARRRLGLVVPEDSRRANASEKVLRAEELLAEERFDDAADLIEPMLRGRGVLEEDLEVRLCIAWSRVLDHRQGLEEAIAWLRRARTSFDGTVHSNARARIDVAAAQLFEQHELYVQAIDAYRGLY